MRIRFNVTKKDIRIGVRLSCSMCPVALSVQRKLGPHIRVGSDSLMKEGPDGTRPLVATLPLAARRFISRFDVENKVKPFSFTLDLPKKYLKKGKA